MDIRPPVLAIAAFAGVWTCTSRNTTLIGLCAAVGVAVGMVSWWRRNWLGVAIALVVLACLPCAALRIWVADQSPIARWATEGAVVTIEARLGAGRSGEAQFGGPWWGAPAVVVAVTGRGETWHTGVQVQIIASGEALDSWRTVPSGSLIRAVVRLTPTDGDTAAQAFARAREPPIILAEPSWTDQVVEQLHAGLRASVSGLAAEPRALLPALVVGDTSLISKQLREDFVITGLTHLTAVSGANLTILLGCALTVAARLGARGWWLRVVSVSTVVFFVVLCRSEPSVLRAAVMGAVGLSALGWGRASQGARYLSWSVVVLVLVDPWLARSAGFALSVAATAGILWWAKRWSQMLSTWLPLWLAEVLCVPVAAQLATQPIVTAISGQVSLVGLLANVLATPLVAPATVLGFAATALSVLSSQLATIPGTMGGWFAQGLCWIASWAAQLPGAAVSWPVDGMALVLLGVVCLGLVLVLPAIWVRRPVVIAVIVLLTAVVIHPPSQPGWPPKSWQIVSCDVGQGDATVLNAADGQAVVIDTGPNPEALDTCLRSLGVTTVVLLVLTHLHADHIGGIEAIRWNRTLGTVLTSDSATATKAWDQVRQNTGNAPHTVAIPGTSIPVGAVTLDIISTRPLMATGETSEGESSAENDSSLVLLAHVGQLDVLLGGDVSEAGQRSAIASGQALGVDVVLIPHHGSAYQDRTFLQATQASVALISVGANNGYGHPAPSLLRLTKDFGMSTFRTDQNGSIAVGTDGTKLQVTVQREPP